MSMEEVFNETLFSVWHGQKNAIPVLKREAKKLFFTHRSSASPGIKNKMHRAQK